MGGSSPGHWPLISLRLNGRLGLLLSWGVLVGLWGLLFFYLALQDLVPSLSKLCLVSVPLLFRHLVLVPGNPPHLIQRSDLGDLRLRLRLQLHASTSPIGP